MKTSTEEPSQKFYEQSDEIVTKVLTDRFQANGLIDSNGTPTSVSNLFLRTAHKIYYSIFVTNLLEVLQYINPRMIAMVIARTPPVEASIKTNIIEDELYITRHYVHALIGLLKLEVNAFCVHVNRILESDQHALDNGVVFAANISEEQKSDFPELWLEPKNTDLSIDRREMLFIEEENSICVPIENLFYKHYAGLYIESNVPGTLMINSENAPEPAISDEMLEIRDMLLELGERDECNSTSSTPSTSDQNTSSKAFVHIQFRLDDEDLF